MSRWLGVSDDSDWEQLACALYSLDARAVLERAGSPDELRSLVLDASKGELSVIVGPITGGVSATNLAAAIVADGNAKQVVIAVRNPSGSLRSRAVRAGVDLVLDLEAVSASEGQEYVDDGNASDGGLTPSSRRASVSAASRSEGAPIIVLCSGRGGVGKTAVVAMSAALAAGWGMRVCAVDLDLSFGNLHSCFSLTHPSDLSRLAGASEVTSELISELSVPAAPGVHVLGPCERPEFAELATPLVGELLQKASEASDLVLVDTSTTFTDAVAQAVQLADRLVIVSDGRGGSAAAVSRAGGLAVRLGVARTRIARLENRSNPRTKGGTASGKSGGGLEAARLYRAFEGGEEVGDLLASGLVMDLVGSSSPFASSVSSMLAQLLAELGCLPDSEEAERAVAGSAGRRWSSFFGRRGEES